MTKREEVYQQAILKWGSRSQLEMAQEEATELALAIRKYIRNDDDASFAKMIDEIADVEIMIEQIEFLHGESANMRGMIDHQKEYKIQRLHKRLNQ